MTRTCDNCKEHTTDATRTFCTTCGYGMPIQTASSGSLDRLVRLCVANHTPEELALGWLRYEALRRVNPRIFAEMNRRNLAGEFFDDIVTEALLSWKSPEQNTEAITESETKQSPDQKS
jgi:hypothetical protein